MATSDTTMSSGDRAEAAAAALDAYLSALQRGEPADREHLLRTHPELASHLACIEELHGLLPATDAMETVSTRAGVTTDGTPRQFGAFEIEAEIGRGGMGVVYRARERGLNRRVALKMILAGQLASGEQRSRFEAEARAAASLQHPHIVPVLQAGELHGVPFLAMQYIEGVSLARKLAAGPLPPDEAARLLTGIAEAVEHLHRHGVVHRDLKPSNILLDEQGHPYVTDFGLAKMLGQDSPHSQSGAVVGTPSYMAPEQAVGTAKTIGPACDVYGLGAILYEMLTGRPPFREATPLDTLVQVLEGEPAEPREIVPTVPRDLERICLRCLEKNPGERFATAQALADDLGRFLRGEPVEALAPSLTARLVRWSRREPALVSRLAMLGLCIILAQCGYQFGVDVPVMLHAEVIGLLLLWALGSCVCQALLNRPATTETARAVWAAVDVVLFSALVAVNGTLQSAVIIGYPLLIAAAGLWFRERLVWLTTGAAIFSYATLLLLEPGVEGMHKHLMFLFGLCVLGYMTAYQVQRVRALSRFYERRPLP